MPPSCFVDIFGHPSSSPILQSKSICISCCEPHHKRQLIRGPAYYCEHIMSCDSGASDHLFAMMIGGNMNLGNSMPILGWPEVCCFPPNRSTDVWLEYLLGKLGVNVRVERRRQSISNARTRIFKLLPVVCSLARELWTLWSNILCRYFDDMAQPFTTPTVFWRCVHME